MNLEALKEISTNNPEILEQSARDNKADEKTIVGIASFAAENGYEKLSDSQKYYFDNCIRPLIEDVQCSGYTHEFEEVHRECEATLDDEDLVEYYQEQGKYCESCEAQASADAHSKESFMRD
ncbi:MULTISPECIES: hypothetical protein [Pseudoalteromonas]|uniref:hypothetical protein n=1 Tax=Pseudoalteromonas TaxID=53246 RepID=UPI000C323F8A|nr:MULTISPECIES: hypothetical protein [Pseudoalteromonas]PKG68293.1 hypothetical protein CXF75_01110 [Pseudoalteromonas arctica]PKG71169.1 hypothetical protein CXF64_06870 [Pseudoalteromonas sp. GutCa3]